MLIIKTYRTGIFLDFISFLMFYPFLLASKSECADCVIMHTAANCNCAPVHF